MRVPAKRSWFKGLRTMDILPTSLQDNPTLVYERGRCESSRVSSVVRAPLSTSVIDHTFSGSCWMSFLHLHHIQAYVLVAQSIPVAIARNLQSRELISQDFLGLQQACKFFIAPPRPLKRLYLVFPSHQQATIVKTALKLFPET